MEKYGTDKPDLRNPLEIVDLTDIFENTEFKAFSGKTVKAISTNNVSEKSRKFFDSMSEYAINELEAKGLAWVKINDNKVLTGGISKFIDEDRKTKIFERMNISSERITLIIK